MKVRFKRILSVLLLVLFAAFLVACETDEPKKFTVTFNSNGGTAVQSVVVDAGSLLSVPTEPTKDNFIFGGWFEDDKLTTKWQFTLDKVESDMTLHAKWESPAAEVFKITFDTKGGNPINPVDRNKGSVIGDLPTPTKAGFEFSGWFLDEATTQSVVTTAIVTSNITVYAKWVEIINEYTVTFNAGLGEVLPESEKVIHNAKVTEPRAVYEGYELVGWYKEQTFETKWDFSKDVVTSNMTLYAKWELIPEGTPIVSQDQFYELVLGLTTYEKNAKFYLKYDLDFDSFNWDGSLFTEDPTRLHDFHLNGNGKTIKNLSFETPATGQGGLIQRMDGGSVSNLTLENIHIKGGNIGGILVGRIVSGSTVKFSDITIKSSSIQGQAAGAGALVGHIQGAQGKADVTVERVVLQDVKVTNNNNSTGGLIGDLESSKLTVKDVLLDVVVETTGERVGGLLGEARRNSSSQDLPELVVDGAVIYANLKGNRYLGTIVGRADNNLHNLEEAIHGTKLKQLPGSISNVVMVSNYFVIDESNSSNGHIARFNAPTATNAYMIAFNYNKEKLNSSNVNSEVHEPNNVDADKLLAKISDLKTTMMAGFNSELWTIEDGKLPVLKGQSITLGHEVTLKVNEELSQVQYVRNENVISPIYINPVLGTFEGWYEDQEFTKEITGVTASLTAYAKLVDKFTVSFETNGGSSVKDVLVTEGDLLTAPEEPTRNLVSFEGWYTDSSLLTKFDFSTPITADIKLYAKWKDDVKPSAEFLTDEGTHVVALEESFTILVKIEDFSVVNITLNVGLEDTFMLTTLASNETNPFYPFITDAEKLKAEALGLTATYDALTHTLAITGSKDLIASTWNELTEVSLTLVDIHENEEVVITRSFKVEVTTTTFTVSFETNGATEIADITVLQGAFVTLPNNPRKDGFSFEGWYLDAELTIAFNPETAITADITLYAKFEEQTYVPEGIAITTTQEFYDLAVGVKSLSEKYYLANDLDFSEFTWTWVNNKSFTGVLDGNFKTIKNLTIVSTSDRAGIFYSINGATVKNIVFDNADISSSGTNRAGIIAGEATGTAVTITNVVVKNSKVAAKHNNGAGALFGYLVTSADISNISVLDTVITNTAQATGGLIGRVGDGNATWDFSVSDVFMKGVTVSGTTRVGGLFGESNGATGYITPTLNRIVLVDMTITGTGADVAGITGRHNPAATNTGFMTDIYVGASITGTSINHLVTVKAYQTVTNTTFFGTLTGTQSGTAAQTVLEAAPTETWFKSTYPSIDASDLWMFSEATGTYILVNIQ